MKGERMLTVYFAWSYMVGFFWNAEQRVLYFCPLPCVVFKIAFWRKGT